jgi:hypothetical protein
MRNEGSKPRCSRMRTRMSLIDWRRNHYCLLIWNPHFIARSPIALLYHTLTGFSYSHRSYILFSDILARAEPLHRLERIGGLHLRSAVQFHEFRYFLLSLELSESFHSFCELNRVGPVRWCGSCGGIEGGLGNAGRSGEKWKTRPSIATTGIDRTGLRGQWPRCDGEKGWLNIVRWRHEGWVWLEILHRCWGWVARWLWMLLKMLGRCVHMRHIYRCLRWKLSWDYSLLSQMLYVTRGMLLLKFWIRCTIVMALPGRKHCLVLMAL